MKKILSVVIIAFILSCSIKQKAADGKPGEDGGKQLVEKQEVNLQSTNRTIVEAITEEAIKKSMEYLASDELGGRATGSEGIEKAAVFIEDYFKANNIKPYFETYRDHFEFKNRRSSNPDEVIKGFNVIGFIEGNDPKLKNEFIILGGHYDHIGMGKEVNGDKIANGANDDASGTIAAMEFGKYFAKSKTNKRSILITLYSAEEMGLKGSGHLAERLKSQGLDAYTMINFEMIGVPRAADKSMAYMSGYKRSNFAETLNKYAGKEVVGFFSKAKEMNLFMRSDNFPFYKELNIPAHAISTFDFTNFDYYHHVDDEASQMDYKHMANFMNSMIPALEGMMNAPTKEVVLNDE
ncbi:M20/M25/M40 family metallo-hydrolase [Winogradskyella echinorum]|uniref:M20/M25/M40 family metallo-hydrolase n=1 Tax=Winogradskyella echinorum TaxID=538189 RepID=A0ABR6Y4A2_9FLAO|nr:M28 family peptidase [Winogradskyella echinorum]MBC3847572.1 M20/M25/M40 family metallo-hydrolase [Winogradskyella echinorum]MBC5751920.1 M20/M25/M40 family metallo-hydrolase [Winogradskyella echinorum]